MCCRLYTPLVSNLLYPISLTLVNDPEVPELHTIEPFTRTRQSLKITPTLSAVIRRQMLRVGPDCKRSLSTTPPPEVRHAIREAI